MRCDGLLDLEGNTCRIGDLNLMLENTETEKYPPVEPEHPERPFFTGLIPMEAEGRPFAVYIPEKYPISGAGMFVWMPDKTDCETFLRDSGFRELAEKYRTALILLQSGAGGWNRKEIQRETEYSLQVFRRALARRYFSMNEATYYAAGLENGAYAAAVFGLLHPEVFSCLLLDGSFQLSEPLLEQIGGLRSDREPQRSKLEIPMPAWLVMREGTDRRLRELLMRSGRLRDEGLYSETAAVYRQDLRGIHISPDSLPVNELRVTDAGTAAGLTKQKLYDKMFAFALGFKRWLGIGNGDLRPAGTWREMGLERWEKTIGGRKREWYLYRPSAHRENPTRKLPLVLAIHGYSCTGELFAENSHWHEVAERRDFFVVYVSAYPSNRAFGGTTVPLPTWNSVGMEAETDDIAYIREVLADVEDCCPVDPERIYVSGHSNGSLMTQTLMAEWPQKFAGFGPQGAQFHTSVVKDEKAGERDIRGDGVPRPVWLMMGEEDIGDAASMEPGKANDLFLNMMCRVNGLNREDGTFLRNGKYGTYTFADKRGIPLLKFSAVSRLPHAYTPEMAWMYWDQYFCHFRRKADGSVMYIP